ncbi:tRNA (N(6)-L-threonylcarbamoyladenosine(37)-C(2))-methylthiotransferase [Candidatus Woesearchaeota archaeon]|nr:tRNA (N(6)-L-threonylcarbamoyladenosine(37)-C(2))-methylthiotransferase [Candidatus Woesearchaeota archaeon]
MVNVCIITYGCAANQDNSAIMAGLLKKEGHKLVKKMEEADVVVINSCIVKHPTESKVRSKINEVTKNYPAKKLIIAGCMPEAEKAICDELALNATLLNTFHVTKIVEAVESAKPLKFVGKREENKVRLPKNFEKTASVQISEGCLGECTFCIVKLAKGKLHSYPLEEVVEEVRGLVENGYKKILLTCQDTATYGLDKNKPQLPALLKKIVAIEGDFVVRVGMMNPTYTLPILNELIEIFESKKIMKFIHIPVQSGSDKVLMDMKRGYSVGDFKKIVTAFRQSIPNITISTDIIVGFPTESEEEFKKTLELLKEIKPEVLNLSKFGSRPGTEAARLKQLRSEVIKRRCKETASLYKKIMG